MGASTKYPDLKSRINLDAFAVCPGGEEGVLKTLAQKWVAGSNPVGGVLN